MTYSISSEVPTCDQCGKPLVERDFLLCEDCEREAAELLEALEGIKDITRLRRMWKKLHGADKPRKLDAAQALHATGRPVCSMMDDDHLFVWVIRNGQVVDLELHDLSPRQPLQLKLALEPGDTVLSFHSHSCAGECDHPAQDFFRGFIIE
ncbi:MAG: hypothetical protein Q4C89_10155 [Deinococcus sp.]|uniref:hypothetical protein n=1 Tax=Deinococcus sp. TaxID=47478 RepID=UPI0026DC39A3|nr:hypothetical protein [Deinococcus sp.]MDO4246374.1 hypothetical protein [Deinococcus sp.]